MRNRKNPPGLADTIEQLTGEIMDHDREEKIRQRAHQMWEADGKPDGRDGEHWHRAVREIDGGGDGDRTETKAEADQTLSEASGSSGAASGLQSGGINPGGGPGASQGSIGTGGGSTGGRPSGDLKRANR
jgi:hypothetical protein